MALNKVKIGNATMINVDCVDYMKSLPDNYFDLAVTDPPYGINGDSHRLNRRTAKAKSTDYHSALWDQPRPSVQYFTELFRVSRNQIIWGGNHLADLIGKFSPCWLVWKKNTTGNFADCELAYTSFQTAVRLFEYTWNGMIQGNHGNKSKNEKRIHPTQKPVALYEWILCNYAEPGMKIYDSHSGSGSMAVAANKHGFDSVSNEIDSEYFSKSVLRVEKAYQQKEIQFSLPNQKKAVQSDFLNE